MRLRVWDVEHGACIMIQPITLSPFGDEHGGRLAMIDAGNSGAWSPSSYIRYVLDRTRLD